MRNLIKSEWQRMNKIYLLVLFTGIFFSCIMVYIKLSGYSYDYNIQIWQESNEVLGLVFPAIAVLPTCWTMYYERKNNYLVYTILRISKTKYIVTKWLVSSCYSAFLIFIISFSGLLVSLYLLESAVPTGTDYAIESFMGYYLVHTPLLYGVILSLWRGLIGFMVASMGFVLSLYANNLFVILVGPFVYCIVENFVLAILNLPYYRLVTSFSPYVITSSAVSTERLLVGPLLLVLAIISIVVYFSVIRKSKIFTV